MYSPLVRGSKQESGSLAWRGVRLIPIFYLLRSLYYRVLLEQNEDLMLRERLRDIRERIRLACERVGRDEQSVTLIAVSKTFPMSSVIEAYQAGIRHFGENRVQELNEKSASLPGVINNGDIYWHMIGHAQRNKAKDIVSNADMIHSVDSLRLAKELNRRASGLREKIPCMIQVNVSGESSKFGLEPQQVLDFMEEIQDLEHLQATGLMTLAAPAENAEDIRPQFTLLRSLRDALSSTYEGIHDLSMGMSGDFEVAIEEGATHVRIGSLLFGSRY